MGLRINNNIAAFNAYRNLSVTDGQMSKSLEKLSSGYRINRAADDAAGLLPGARPAWPRAAELAGAGSGGRPQHDRITRLIDRKKFSRIRVKDPLVPAVTE